MVAMDGFSWMAMDGFSWMAVTGPSTLLSTLLFTPTMFGRYICEIVSRFTRRSALAPHHIVLARGGARRLRHV